MDIDSAAGTAAAASASTSSSGPAAAYPTTTSRVSNSSSSRNYIAYPTSERAGDFISHPRGHTAKRIIFIRHCESVYNQMSRLLSAELPGARARYHIDLPDAPLNSRGREQAALLRHDMELEYEFLQNVELVVTSPFRRALQTTQQVVRELLRLVGNTNVPIMAHPLLRERRVSSHDFGTRLSELAPEYPDINFEWVRAAGECWWYDDGVPEDRRLQATSEPEEVFMPRVYYLQEWLCSRPEKNIIVVGHSICMQRFLGIRLENGTRLTRDLPMRLISPTREGPTEAVIVLGLRLQPHLKGRVSEALAIRVRAGLSVYRDAVSTYGDRGVAIVFSGGNPAGLDRSEAQAMLEYAVEQNLATREFTHLLLEDHSENTYANAYLTLRMIRERKLPLRRVIIVTSTWHARRTRLIFERAFEPLHLDSMIVAPVSCGNADRYLKENGRTIADHEAAEPHLIDQLSEEAFEYWRGRSLE